ncbi:hydroxyethylthiazole kinase [Adlercreutzia equolifaciens]|uniref:hydroxyethylthiazole kinase n=1 Tax=Adlercreutzia equolifaciens TaxID=446660 RepID=UPI0023B07B6F|nr:hydroxyethylthiazole kinase [Adlercreutzia equolifaciens]MDE8702558.1 hydroxyethylthiazole kinase [Adlercreutzia equolifaciens]
MTTFTETELRALMAKAVREVRATNPLAPSITNTVTQSFVANAQLAVGGSAAMVYLPDEGEAVAQASGATYINLGTLLPIYEETIPRTAQALAAAGKPWVLDPVGIGIGSLRSQLLRQVQPCKPALVRANASEVIALANLWGLEADEEVTDASASGPRGVDATDSVDAAEAAAAAIARFTEGAVAVSGPIDLVTDGTTTVRLTGGSPLMECITGAGCSLGGVAAVFCCVADPFVAALAATATYNVAGTRAAARTDAPGSFQVAFLDELYHLTSEDVADAPMKLEAR